VLAAASLGVAALLGRAGVVWLRVRPTARYWRGRADAKGELLYVALGDSTVRVVNLSVTGARADGTVGANDAGRTSPEAFRTTVRRLVAALPPGARVADVPDFGYGATRAMTWRDYVGDYFHPGDRGYRRYFRAFGGPDVSGRDVVDRPGGP